jgi:hypothetical protein
VAQAALDSAVNVASLLPAAAPALYAALGVPFSARLLDEARLLARTRIAMHMKGTGACLPTLDALEPHMPWRLDILAWRAHCYDKLGDPRAVLARGELEEFAGEQPASLADALP